MKTHRVVVGDDELSQLIRIVRLPETAEDISALTKPPEPQDVNAEMFALMENCARLLEELNHPDIPVLPNPMQILVLKDGEWSGETIPLDLHVKTHDLPKPDGVEHELGARVLVDHLALGGHAFSDAWYCALLIERAFGAILYLNADRNRREHCLMNVAFLLRDWEWRRKHGQRARGRIRQEKARPKATAARREKARDREPDWWDTALIRAGELRSRNTKRSRTDIAKQLADEFRRSRRQISDVIKPLWK